MRRFRDDFGSRDHPSNPALASVQGVEILAHHFPEDKGGVLMEEEINAEESTSQRRQVGRTWADVLVGSSYVFGGILFISGVFLVAWWFYG